LDKRHAVGLGEFLSAGADEVDVRTFLKDEAGGLDGITNALYAGDTSGFHAAAVHKKGIELNPSVGGEEASAACVERGVIFHPSDSSFDGIDSGAAASEDGVSGQERVSYASFVGCLCICGYGPGSAMDEQDWFHSAMVADDGDGRL
jgi:hypothetical protein